eukprot:CAMPEP_0194783034 /NCGR_PEP_ID=MMETSP0323_2-20130528/79008_1 /TAXON_ID=2866 ORGANISM="Crypthecodinium cohnii, Strain Seligo" /NCGR_SAMPLE_ID=MMETSP0323_2 /ASSEMBLY_ACC=CAM_ASM_000346 /LENGTH=219 /DNA_ID=CAMNT_0039721887 /DNA_START=675 /DNA_END=1335 /DNA_ORIENTATION=+
MISARQSRKLSGGQAHGVSREENHSRDHVCRVADMSALLRACLAHSASFSRINMRPQFRPAVGKHLGVAEKRTRRAQRGQWPHESANGGRQESRHVDQQSHPVTPGLDNTRLFISLTAEAWTQRLTRGYRTRLLVRDLPRLTRGNQRREPVVGAAHSATDGSRIRRARGNRAIVSPAAHQRVIARRESFARAQLIGRRHVGSHAALPHAPAVTPRDNRD